MEENKLEQELQKLIDDAVNHRANVRDKEYINNLAHYEGLHWNLVENKDESPFMLKSDINHLKNAVDLRLGSLFSESYFGELQPLSPNDVEAINTLNLLYKNEWTRLNADDFVEAAIKNGCIHDNGYTEVNFDTGAIFGGTGTRNEGSIVLRNISTSDVYLDPRAESIDDCEYIVVKKKVTKNWIKRHKQEWLSKIEEENLKAGSVDNNLDGNIYIGREYNTQDSFVIDIVERKYSEEVDASTVDEETGETIVDKVTITRVKIHYLMEGILLETNDNYPFDDFNYIPFQWEPEPQSPYGVPLLRGLTVPQKVANLIESAANNVAMHYSTPTWLVSDESGLDVDDVSKLVNAVGVAWLVSGDVTKAMKQMEYPDVNEQLIAIKENFVQNIKNYSGISDTYIGNIGTAGSTAEGTNMAVNRATVIDNAPMKQIEKYVEKLSRMIIKFMTRYYKGQTIYIRDTKKQKDGEYTFKDFFVGENLENINYDFTVKLSSRSKSDKNRQYNLLKDLYQLQNQYRDPNKVINVTDLVKAAQLDNFDEMFKRYTNMSAEAYEEKADLIVQLMQVAQTYTPNGTPLISTEEIQQGIIDVLDDNGDLTLVQNIFSTYEEYQTALADFNNNMALKDQQNRLNSVKQMGADFENQLAQNQQALMGQTQ